MNKTPDLSRLIPIVVDDLVRVGRDHDGGYVVSERTIKSADVLIGLGINTDWSFETDFMRRNPKVGLIAVDGSISKSRFAFESWWHALRALGLVFKLRRSLALEAWGFSRESRKLHREFVALVEPSNHVFFERMLSDEEGWTGLAWSGIAKLVAERFPNAAGSKLFVKMDIEGSEYRVIPELAKSSSNIQGMVIEFHDCDLLAETFDETVRQLQERFVIVHTHGNNHAPLASGSTCPRALELTLVRRELISAAESSSPNSRVYPLANLDQPNRADKADYVFLPMQQRRD